jgi:chorismate mutase/prephenate dehydratase
MLQIFARAGLNLEKLESRPIPEESWSYSFYADFTGNLQQGDLDPVIRELINESSSFRILGNYKAASL